jgi:hypothetical protein
MYMLCKTEILYDETINIVLTVINASRHMVKLIMLYQYRLSIFDLFKDRKLFMFVLSYFSALYVPY